MAKKKKRPQQKSKAAVVAKPAEPVRGSNIEAPAADDSPGATDKARPKSPATEKRVTDKRPTDKRAARRPGIDQSPATDLPPAKPPVFWFGFEIAWAKLACTRFIVFAMLALDAVLQVSHAPRYGAGDFNVGQLPFLDAIGAGRTAFGVAQLVLAYLFVTIAFGVGTRVLVPIAAAIYAWIYFGSQLDSYQHHYLVVIVLAIASFVPWQRPADAKYETPVRVWAVRLLLVQLAIMYVWAAISKMNLAWVDGTTLALQMKGSIAAAITKSVGFKVASVMVILVELVLAATVWTRPGWKIAAPLGLLFHLGIVFTGLEIGLFAFLMLGIYALVIPDIVWVAVLRWFDGLVRWLGKPSVIAVGVAIVLGVALAVLVRVEDALAVGIGVAIVPLALVVRALVKKQRPTIAVAAAHVVALALWVFVDRFTSTTADYYRFWGGSQRRIGKPEVAEHAYRRLTEIDPDAEAGHFQLGRLLIQRGAVEDGLRELHEAQRVGPNVARGFIEEARVLNTQGKKAQAIEKAKQATFADPSHAQARALLDALTTNKPAKPVDDDAND
jgi:hypothetical protein